MRSQRVLGLSAAALSAVPSGAQVDSMDDAVSTEPPIIAVFHIRTIHRDDDFHVNPDFFAPYIKDARTYPLPGRDVNRSSGTHRVQRQARRHRQSRGRR